MSVPDRVAAARLLRSLNPPAWFLRHSRAVAEVAGWLAARAGDAGRPIDRPLVEAAALLHDVDKLLPHDDPVRRLGHGAAGATWLADQGHAELALPIAGHPVTRLADDAWWSHWRTESTLEERIVAYADKCAGQRLESMAARFAHWARRYPVDAPDAAWDVRTAALVRERAEELERDVCAGAGVRPGDVRRLRWTGSALAAAERQP